MQIWRRQSSYWKFLLKLWVTKKNSKRLLPAARRIIASWIFHLIGWKQIQKSPKHIARIVPGQDCAHCEERPSGQRAYYHMIVLSYDTLVPRLPASSLEDHLPVPRSRQDSVCLLPAHSTHMPAKQAGYYHMIGGISWKQGYFMRRALILRPQASCSRGSKNEDIDFLTCPRKIF